MVSALELLFADGRIMFHNIDRDIFIWQSDNLISFTFHYYTENDYPSAPFNLILDYDTVGGTNYLGLFISLGVIFLSCLVCSFCFYKCSRMIAENSRRRENRRNPNGLDLVSNNQNNPNNMMILQDISHNAQNEILLKKKNKEILERMLLDELKPVAYREVLNEYNSSCTICIEGFSINQVDVTILNCKHIFHHSCLKDWLYKNIINTKCPNCNYNVIDRNFPGNEIKVVPISDSTDRRFISPDNTRSEIGILHHNSRLQSFQNLDRLNNN
jgi:hypothetical protein